jgi:hypothetical protein
VTKDGAHNESGWWHTLKCLGGKTQTIQSQGLVEIDMNYGYILHVNSDCIVHMSILKFTKNMNTSRFWDSIPLGYNKRISQANNWH